MTRFPTAAHLAAWAGVAPGNNESAGKRRRAQTRKGSPWLRAALVEAAQAAGRTKSTYLGAQFRRLLPHKGKKRTVVAVAHSILVIVAHLLTKREPDQDLRVTYFNERTRQAVERRLVRRLEALGYTVSLQSPGPAAKPGHFHLRLVAVGDSHRVTTLPHTCGSVAAEARACRPTRTIVLAAFRPRSRTNPLQGPVARRSLKASGCRCLPPAPS
jgi:hypothetical protein